MKRLIVVAGLAATVTACGTSQAAAPQASPSTFSVHSATLKACQNLVKFENGNSDLSFANDPASATVLNDADNTPLEQDIQTWVNDQRDGSPFEQTQADANKVGADCGAVGVPVFTVPS